MAKAKIGFDSARLKQLFLLHGEKLALGVGVVLSAYFAYGATQVEPYPKKPQELQSAVTQGRARLDKSHINTPGAPPKFDIVADGVTLPTEEDRGFKEVINEELVNPLLAAKFAGKPINLPLFEKKRRRGEPTFLAVRDLRTAFYHGAVNTKGANPDAAVPVGEEFIAVTGVVPFEEQSAAHAKAFQNTLDPLRNAIPLYSKYEIRRAEVKTSDPSEAVDWDKIEPLNLQAAVIDWLGKWSGPAEDGTDRSFVSWPPSRGYGPLTEPLPPLTNKDYGSWATHPELVAVAAPGLPVPEAPVAPVAPQQPLGDVFGGGGAVAPAAQPAAAPLVAADAVQARPKQLLFRFLDFNIEEGKRYRYRVKLILKNPNLNLDQAQLEKPEFAVTETRDAPWSDPSTTAEYPYLDRQFAGRLKFPSGDIEPEAGTGVKWWFPQLAAAGYIRFEEIKGTPATGETIIGKMRGGALNGDVKVTYLSPGKHEPATATVNFPPPPSPTMLVVDFAWERIDARPFTPGGRPINRPSEVLLLNPRGELKIAIQTMDASWWSEQRATIGTGSGAAPPGGPPPGGVQLLGGTPPAETSPPAAAATPTGTEPVLRLQ